MRSRIEYNEQYLIRDGHPWFPVMGEFHFSRYRADFWEESLRKMKAAGVSVVSAYVIWIHHEEEEGTFDFTGCRDLGLPVSHSSLDSRCSPVLHKCGRSQDSRP